MPPLTLLLLTADTLLLRLLATRYPAPDYLLIGESDPALACRALHSFAPDLIVCDGGSDNELRRHAARQGIPLLTLGADAPGASMNLSKPFTARNLFARIESLLPDVGSDTHMLEADGLRLNRMNRRVSARGEEIPLHARCFDLLAMLMTHVDRVFSRAQLLDRVWGDEADVNERTVDVFIGRLRRALATHGFADRIETVRSAGYRFRPPAAPQACGRPLSPGDMPGKPRTQRTAIHV